jgi:hypothetical protein
MFKRIVISIPQEQFPELAIRRGRDLSDRLDSKIYMSYIIEDTVFNEVGSQARHVLAESEKEKFEKKMVKSHEKVAKKVILKEAENILGEEPYDFSTVHSFIDQDHRGERCRYPSHGVQVLQPYEIQDNGPITGPSVDRKA